MHCCAPEKSRGRSKPVVRSPRTHAVPAAATMLPHTGSQQGEMGGDGAQGGHFIFAQEAAIALDISMQDRSEFALQAPEARTRGLVLITHRQGLSYGQRVVVKRLRDAGSALPAGSRGLPFER
jgi:hypothetical protein